ncbi:MAG TPA: nucleotidyltransferase family protein, partial [Elusimicrobiales bacterium]|nr:nucleotidyltransferase family protein [Elusimicrobiales bacterium]
MQEATASARQIITARNAVLLQALDEILAAAAAEALPVMPIKGAALCLLGIYELGEREFADLDLLVKQEDRPRFKKLLVS